MILVMTTQSLAMVKARFSRIIDAAATSESQ